MTNSIIIAIICILVISIAVIYFYARGDCYISYEIFADRRIQKIHRENVDESIVDCVLAIICEVFDMDPADSGRIREHDTVKAIYDSWYRGSFVPFDDCELERFHAMLKALIHLTDKELDVSDDFLVVFPVTKGVVSGCWSVVYTERDTPPMAEDLLCGKVEIQEKLSPHWYYLHSE